jgi:hypothetical protein
MSEFPKDSNFIDQLARGKTLLNVNSREQTLVKLRAELGPIFSENYYTFVHLTPGSEEAEYIMKNGLGFIAPGMTYSTSLILDQPESLRRFSGTTFQRKGKATEAIIILMFPKSQMKLNEGILSAKNDLDFLKDVEPDDHLKTVELVSKREFRWKIEPKYIRGYWDIKAKRLVLNDKFEENPAPPVPQDQN